MKPVEKLPWLRAAVVALALPAVIALVGSLIVRPEPATLITPLLGPWAGLALGHHHCTLATLAPGLTVSVVGLGLAVAAAWAFLRSPIARILVPVLSAVWALAWSALAFFSVLNTTS